MITGADIDNWFSYHEPTDKDVLAYETIRASARDLARVILTMTPPCADQTVAIRKLRECVMTANAAIACYDEFTTTKKE